MKKYLLSAFAIVALLFAACGGDDGVSTTVPVSGIKLDKSSLSLEIGQKATLTATIAPSDATNKSITWSSANQNIATVNNGVVSGVAAGETTITAKTNDGGFTASATVKVTPEAVKVTQIKLVGVPTEAKEGRIITISAVITPTDATDMTVTFTSSNPDVVKVEFTKSESNYSLATLTAVSPGKAKITATANDGSGVKAEAEVTVIPTVKVSDISLVVSKSEIKVGYMVRATATISPEDADNKEIEWSSSNTAIARLKAVEGANNKVDIIGVSPGTATITATAKDGSGVKASTTVTVMGPIPTSITFDGTAPYEFDYWQGKVIDFKKDLKMKVEPADADFNRIEWRLSIESARDDVSGEEVKYEVKDDNVTLSYAHSTNWVAPETVHATAYVDGVEIGSVSIIMQNRGMLLYTTDLSLYYDIAMQANKMNWNNRNVTRLRYICYNKIVGTDGKYDKYQIPSSEYTLTSSDESKIKVTKNDDGKSWQIERLNTTDLVAVTLTYKCGEHTQTYTINLIP